MNIIEKLKQSFLNLFDKDKYKIEIHILSCLRNCSFQVAVPKYVKALRNIADAMEKNLKDPEEVNSEENNDTEDDEGCTMKITGFDGESIKITSGKGGGIKLVNGEIKVGIKDD